MRLVSVMGAAACQQLVPVKEKGEGRRETGDGRRRRETGDGRRETGDGRRGTGDGRRETGDGRSEKNIPSAATVLRRQSREEEYSRPTPPGPVGCQAHRHPQAPQAHTRGKAEGSVITT